jgi:hypothetical protein
MFARRADSTLLEKILGRESVTIELDAVVATFTTVR